MSLDPYSPCPCDSGKKLKFCCADIAGDMIKALQLHESGQSKASLKILEKLYEKDPTRAWVATSLAGIYLYLEESVSSQKILEPLLKSQPDHPLARVLDATAALDIYGFENSRGVTHRAFIKGIKAYPEMIGSLAAGIASELYADDKIMAARQHLSLAMKLVRDEDRQSIFMRMLDLDGEINIPYPLRGAHQLKDAQLPAEEGPTIKKALSLSAIGCWHEAAKLLTPMAEKYPDNGLLLYNLGLFHAWDGNETKAQTYFENASSRIEDFELAVACQTLAQLLTLEGNLIVLGLHAFEIERMSLALTELEKNPRFIIKKAHDYRQDDKGTYKYIEILDRAPTDNYPRQVTSSDQLKQLSLIVGMIILFERESSADREPPLMILRVKPEYEQAVLEEIHQTGLKLIDVEFDDEDAKSFGGEIDWEDFAPFLQQHYTPADWEYPEAKQYEMFWRDHIIQNLWPHHVQSVLGNRAPAELVGKPEEQVKLAAAINVLDAHADKNDWPLDINTMRQKMQLPPLRPLVIEEDQQLNSCDSIELMRIEIGNLAPEQLLLLINRVQLLQHKQMCETITSVLHKQPHLLEPRRMVQLLHNSIDRANAQAEFAVVLERIEQAREWSRQVQLNFEEHFQWELRELQTRAMLNPKDDMTEFLNNLYNRYLRKLPEMEQIVTAMLQRSNIQIPWHSSTRAFGSAMIDNGEIWTPEQEAPSRAGSLWIPGQSE